MEYFPFVGKYSTSGKLLISRLVGNSFYSARWKAQCAWCAVFELNCRAEHWNAANQTSELSLVFRSRITEALDFSLETVTS